MGLGSGSAVGALVVVSRQRGLRMDEGAARHLRRYATMIA